MLQVAMVLATTFFWLLRIYEAEISNSPSPKTFLALPVIIIGCIALTRSFGFSEVIMINCSPEDAVDDLFDELLDFDEDDLELDGLDDLDEDELGIFLKIAVMVLFLFIVVTQTTFSAGP